ncbi:MAG: winged helix-turn-helix transcriptional regulator [candidate division WOR-3 bacterium]|nr:MAG: winged helix-turn-helix transcriptional regulator [candidate division WOR-3 bacterium]
MKIREKKYRGSLICRTIGYPISYAIVRMLLEHGPMNLQQIVKRVKRSKATVCVHLAKLKLANIVRYEKEWRKTMYWIKYPREVKKFLQACEELVERTTKRIKKDF